MSGSVSVLEYNGTLGVADPGYSTEVLNLNLFYEVRRTDRNRSHGRTSKFTYNVGTNMQVIRVVTSHGSSPRQRSCSS